MKGLIEFVAGRKETVRLVAFMHCAVAMFMLTACAGRKEFQKGYERGLGGHCEAAVLDSAKHAEGRAGQGVSLSSHPLPDTSCTRSERDGQNRAL